MQVGNTFFKQWKHGGIVKNIHCLFERNPMYYTYLIYDTSVFCFQDNMECFIMH